MMSWIAGLLGYTLMIASVGPLLVWWRKDPTRPSLLLLLASCIGLIIIDPIRFGLALIPDHGTMGVATFNVLFWASVVSSWLFTVVLPVGCIAGQVSRLARLGRSPNAQGAAGALTGVACFWMALILMLLVNLAN